MTLDEAQEAVVKRAKGAEKEKYFFGEAVGLMVFRPWYPAISAAGHANNMQTYDFPVRLAFVDDPFDPVGYVESSSENGGWNIKSWITAARQLEEDGVRAIVSGCGLAGSIHSKLQASLEIPLYSATLQFVNHFADQIGRDKRVGILTIGENFLNARNQALFAECGVDKNVKIACAGMYNSEYKNDFMKYLMETGNVEVATSDVVNTVMAMIEKYPDIGGIVVECTDLPPFSQAIREATGLPVFDPVDMVKQVHNEVK
ncbi:aspartate/glutamate racemase family protein [Hellea sp.]|nr:aspartate/glutamate racemase family protein [Hellea sp.]MDA8889161.1 aspartate/glutamate racemase family protein [Hellea sp.]MDB4845239.1 aspartate/glutamate racemase family protein [Hellea sp.]MDC0421997.1 aspartate/glutamate racemase family protein [Hellea sp.]MDC1088757.1 aspartate/glutamate racemase family protein [Hellea sp.]